MFLLLELAFELIVSFIVEPMCRLVPSKVSNKVCDHISGAPSTANLQKKTVTVKPKTVKKEQERYVIPL